MAFVKTVIAKSHVDLPKGRVVHRTREKKTGLDWESTRPKKKETPVKNQVEKESTTKPPSKSKASAKPKAKKGSTRSGGHNKVVFSAREEEEILRLYTEEMKSVVTISEMTGYSITPLRRLLQEHKVLRERSSKRVLTEKDYAEIERLYLEEGLDIREVAGVIKVSVNTVQRYLKKKGLSRPRGTRSATKRQQK